MQRTRRNHFEQVSGSPCKDAVANGFYDATAVETLVTQICYRAADLGFLIKQEGTSLARYSDEL